MAVGSEQKTITNAAAQVLLDGRDATHFLIHNKHATVSVWLGESGVTAATGYELAAGETLECELTGKDKLYAKSGGADVLVHVLKGT